MNLGHAAEDASSPSPPVDLAVVVSDLHSVAIDRRHQKGMKECELTKFLCH